MADFTRWWWFSVEKILLLKKYTKWNISGEECIQSNIIIMIINHITTTLSSPSTSTLSLSFAIFNGSIHNGTNIHYQWVYIWCVLVEYWILDIDIIAIAWQMDKYIKIKLLNYTIKMEYINIWWWYSSNIFFYKKT